MRRRLARLRRRRLRVVLWGGFASGARQFGSPLDVSIARLEHSYCRFRLRLEDLASTAMRDAVANL